MSTQAPPDAPPRRSALHITGLVWSALVAIIPATFGVIMIVHYGAVTTPGATASAVFRAMALRNFAFSAVLLYALATQPRRVLGILLAARGLTEWADGLSGVFATSAAASMAPYVGGLGDLFFAYYFVRAKS